MNGKMIVAAAILLAGCTAKRPDVADSSATGAMTDTGAAALAAAAAADPDRNVADGGLPSGYTGRTDRADAPLTGARYAPSGGMWEITTGPAHILYAAKDVGAGNYTASTKFEQLEKPTHPEAFGLIIGGRDLDKPTQTYTYFLVRSTGEMLVKVRDGDKTRDVVKWSAGADIPKADAAGKASYALAAQVTGDAVKFMVNGKQVGSVSKVGLPTDGIAGLRVNHNLHLKASPVVVSGS